MSSFVEQSEFTPFLKKMTLFASGGVFWDGYILVIIGIALVQLDPILGLDSLWSGLPGAASLVGILIGGLVFGYVTENTKEGDSKLWQLYWELIPAVLIPTA